MDATQSIGLVIKPPRGYLESMSIPIVRNEKLQARLNAYYSALATVDSLSEKEQKKLYKDISRSIEKLRMQEEDAKEWAKILSDSRDELEARLKDTQNSEKTFLLLFRRAPANGTIDYQEKLHNHFARGMNFYKLFLILFIGSFAGVIIELLWCFIRHGYFESRSGLVYGPFNLVYGLGALCLTLTLYRYRNRSAMYSFIGGFITGSVVEYLCSYFQEMLFGSTSWDYSRLPFNLNGRICLLYSIFWGFLGILWIKSVYPRLATYTLKIPNNIGKTLVWVLLVFMVFNSIVSGLAVFRWSERIEGKPASNALERLMDERFPDERLEKIYPNLVFQEETD